ncbi:MAG TPA: short chain dehydrogenase [Thermoanaerobaculia bacterium]|nr:short chain dehydrogenase [Thermoanaerobaculia bacterium]
MRIVVVGATGTIGKAIVAALSRDHEVLPASRRSKIAVDITDPESIRAMYRTVGRIDALVSAAGDAKFAPLSQLTDANFQFSLNYKLMGQVNLVRFGMDAMNDGGSFTVTSGILARRAMPGSAAISLVNAGLEGFVRAAALEAPRGIRVNAASPPWITDTMKALGMDPSGGMTPEAAAQLYVRSVTSKQTGAVIE